MLRLCYLFKIVLFHDKYTLFDMVAVKVELSKRTISVICYYLYVGTKCIFENCSNNLYLHPNIHILYKQVAGKLDKYLKNVNEPSRVYVQRPFTIIFIDPITLMCWTVFYL